MRSIVGRVLLTASGEALQGMLPLLATPAWGGQGILAIPVVYNGWVQNLPAVVEESPDAGATQPDSRKSLNTAVRRCTGTFLMSSAA